MRKITVYLISAFLLSFLFVVSPINVYAHENLLDIEYDECSPDENGDGEDEIWYYLSELKYSLEEELEYYHLDDDVTTIKYYFEENDLDGTGYSWNTDVNDDLAEEIRQAYINSVMEWNKVYYYTYVNGQPIPRKIINIIEGTRDDHNLSIYPMRDDGSGMIASTGYIRGTSYENVDTGNELITHKHYSDWIMMVNVSYFYVNSITNISENGVEIIRANTGEHEMGHILGLDDVDVCCTKRINDHHEEILMGYGDLLERQFDVTYKDIAGVSIIRGFHTDDDHVWMKRNNDDGTIDLICAQCNGVLYDIEMDSNGTTYQGKSVNIYKNCLHHNGTASNMLLVATDGDRDFFKCQNCRHIETVDITGEYDMSNYSTTFNKIVSLNHNETKYYKIKINTNKCYEFIVNGVPSINFKLYDENFNEISYNDLDSASNKVRFANQFNVGTYYLECKFTNETSSGNISIQVNFKPDLITGNNNVVSQYLNDYYDYVYANNISAGFYKITLNATNSLGTIDYPEGCIKVYADEAKQQMLARLETIFYTLDAETQGDSNNLIVFLEYGESYYINIDLPSDTYSSMNINIERLSNTYDIIESDIDEEHVILNENTTAYGDYIQRIEILEAGTYTIAFTHEGPQSEENLSGQEDPLYLYYAFYKEVSSPAEQFGDLEMIFPHIASSMGGTISFTFNLQPGVYYIGYYNKLNNEPMTISITS